MRDTNRYFDESATGRGNSTATGVSDAGASPSNLREARNEISTLRSINGHLVRQIAMLEEREAQALRLADRDGLTGLYNRRKMFDLLDDALSAASQQNHRVGLLFIDLDGFKQVNDRYGHAVGDKLLLSVASRLANRARTGDFVCRYGGDEYVVVLPRLGDASAVRQVADSMARRISMPFRLDGGVELKMTASIGWSIYPDEAQSVADLMERADRSMYRAKAECPVSSKIAGPLTAPTRRRDDLCGRGMPLP